MSDGPGGGSFNEHHDSGAVAVELKSVHGREPARWGRPHLDHQEGVGPAPLSTMSCNWWRLFAVRLGSGVGRSPSIDVTDALPDERLPDERCGFAELACGWPIRSHTTRVVGRA
jgi:hypothetical protein